MAIKIYKDEAASTVFFEGQTRVKPIPTNVGIASETVGESDRIKIVRTDQFIKGSSEFKILFKRLKYTRIRDKNNNPLATRADAITYLNQVFNQVESTDVNAAYMGLWDAFTDTPTISGSHSASGDWYYVGSSGSIDPNSSTSATGSTLYRVNDIVKFISGSTFTGWQHIVNETIRVDELDTTLDNLTNSSSLSTYDLYVDATYTGVDEYGTPVKPFKTLVAAVSASSAGDTISVKGCNEISSELVLPHSLHLYGSEGSEIKYTSYSTGNGDVISFTGTDYTQEFTFKNLIIKNAGGYGIYTTKTARVKVEDCVIQNNGWNGSGLSTVLAESGGTLGYDSSNTDLQAFYAGASASNGGAMRIQESSHVLIVGNTVSHNLRGIRLQDCGVNGGGFITRNQSSHNIESGIYLAAGSTYYGCQNLTVTMNVSAYNSNNGLLVIGGLNNKFSQNEVNGNWNAGFCAWGAANSTLRDCGLYDNNRSQYNGIGNSGDAKASIQINEAYNLLGTTISLNEDARFIAEVLDTQVHYTGVGSNTERIGFLITSGVGALADNDKNIIRVDDVGFIGQDYAIDFSEVDITNLRISLGDNSYETIGTSAVKAPLNGNYNELPFSNHIMSVPSLDVVADVLKSIVTLTEGIGGHVINVYNVNELLSNVDGTEIEILQKGSNRIQLRNLNHNNITINGNSAGNSLNSVNDNLNAAFHLNITDYKEFLTSEIGINTGETLPAQTENWYIAYGADSGSLVPSAGINATYKDKQPFYNGDFLEKGHEYTWSHYDDADYMIGIWSGAEAEHNEANAVNTINWSTGFFFDENNDNFNPDFCSGVDIASRYSTGYTVNSSTVLALRYGNDNYLYLLDITGGSEVIIAKSNTTLVGDSQTIFFAGENQPNAQFPVMQERTDRWTIVHDFDDSENGEWVDGIENQTIIKSNMFIEPGQKFTFDLPSAGINKHYGLSYNGAATGVANPISGLMDGVWRWDAQEIIHNMVGWTFNTSSAGYGRKPSYSTRWGVADGQIHTVSYRHKSDNTLEMWSEEDNDLIMTYNISTSGTPIHLFFGSVQNASPYSAIPVLGKYDLSATEQNQNVTTWYYIESPDGNFTYPLFASANEANTIDTLEGGSGSSQGYSWGDDPTGATWYAPDTNKVINGSVAPSHGVYGNSTNIIWNIIATDADSTYAPTAFSDTTITLNESSTLNGQIHPAGATFVTTIANAPSWITQVSNNGNITGTSPEILGDNINFPSSSYTVDIVRTFAGYGSSIGTLTVDVTNTTPSASLPGTMHVGSVTDSSATNSAGKIYLQVVGGHLVYDLPNVLEDGDKIEWYHQDSSYGFGIVASGSDKTSDLLEWDADNSSKWDLLAPIGGSPTHTNGQNFGNNYSTIWTGFVPLGWDDNTNPQVIPTRPIYASTDVWKLYNNSGTIELSLNDNLFRSSSATYTDPVITFAMPEKVGSGGVLATTEFPIFTHTANAASAPSGFTLEHGSMDTSLLLGGNSAVTLDNLSLSPGQRFIATKSWINTNILSHIDGTSGEDNKVFVGISKPSAAWGNVQISDFWSVLRSENQTTNLTKYTKHHTGPTPSTTDLNRFSDSDSNLNFGIEFTREGDLVTIWSPDTNPSLNTEPITGTFGHIQNWTGSYTTIGTGSQELAIATRETETRVNLSLSGLSVITAPSKANEFDVTEDTFNLPLFNGSVGGDITLNASQTYKFWLHSDTIESTDSLGFCLISDNSDYTTGVTSSGTPGTFGSYVEFNVPSDVPPVKFKWTSGGSYYYSTPVIAGSSYSYNVTGVTHEGPATLSGTVASDSTWYSLNESLSGGERLIITSTILTDIFAEMNNLDELHIGLKSATWANTKDGSANGNESTTGFAGGLTIKLSKNSSGTKYIRYELNGVEESYSYGTSQGTSISTQIAFDLTTSGNNVRLMHQHGGQGNNLTTTAYGDWGDANAPTEDKVQTGDIGLGLSSADVMIYWKDGGTDSFDYDEVDWTNFSEVNIPASTTIVTDWDKAIDFGGSNEHLKQVSNSSSTNPLRMTGIGATASANSDSSKTSNATYSRPWATAVVFKIDGNSSNQHVWNSGEGAGSNDDNIYLRVTSFGALYFGWGRDGSLNEYLISTNLGNSAWYGVYIGHKGTRLSGSNATNSNLLDAFDIKLMFSNGTDWVFNPNPLFGGAGAWTTTGGRMDRTVTGDFTIGGRGSNRNFHGKVAAMTITTLRRNVVMPTDAEIKMMITDPTKWVTDYKNGQTFRYGNSTSEATFRATGRGNTENFATQVWLMGDGTSDSYSNGIRNTIYPSDQNYTKLQFNSMASNDIENVTINGLS